MRLQRHVSRVHSDERGQVTAYFVGISILLFAIMAFSFDLGLLHLQRRTVQNSVDRPFRCWYLVLSPTSNDARLPASGHRLLLWPTILRTATWASGRTSRPATTLQTALSTFHVENDVGSVDWTSVKARVDRAQGYIFGRFLGLVGANVPAEAEAVCGAISRANLSVLYSWRPEPSHLIMTRQPAVSEFVHTVYRLEGLRHEGQS